MNIQFNTATVWLPGSPQMPVVSGEDFMKMTSLVGISLKLLFAWSATVTVPEKIFHFLIMLFLTNEFFLL